MPSNKLEKQCVQGYSTLCLPCQDQTPVGSMTILLDAMDNRDTLLVSTLSLSLIFTHTSSKTFAFAWFLQRKRAKLPVVPARFSFSVSISFASCFLLSLLWVLILRSSWMFLPLFPLLVAPKEPFLLIYYHLLKGYDEVHTNYNLRDEVLIDVSLIP